MSTLKLDHVTKIYDGPRGPVRAVEDLSLDLEAGQFVALCGPSGCGKTTVLMCAGAMLSPTEGRVLFDGQDLYRLGPEARAAFRARHIGFVFQQFHLVAYLTVRQNVLAAALALPGRSVGRQVLRQADALLERLGLADRADHRPAELSSGERQRTALARALLNRPGLLLADEPTGNLDPDNAAVVLDHLADFARSGGAVLLVTHDRSAAARADRLLHMAGGRLVETPPAERETAGV